MTSTHLSLISSEIASNEQVDPLLNHLLAMTETTYGGSRIQEAWAEFNRWKPISPESAGRYSALFRAWLLFDWTPDANDPTLPRGVVPERTPAEHFLETLDLDQQKHSLLTQICEETFSFFHIRSDKNTNVLQITNLMNDEQFQVPSSTDIPRGTTFGLIIPPQRDQPGTLISSSPEVFGEAAQEQIKKFRIALNGGPLRRDQMREFAIELFDAYHALKKTD